MKFANYSGASSGSKLLEAKLLEVGLLEVELLYFALGSGG